MFKINVKNVHMAEITEESEVLTFGTPEHIAGAMEIGRTPTVASGELYGDGTISHTTNKKVSYQLTLNHNKIPSKWRRYMEGSQYETGVESGTSEDQPKPLAIGWEVEKTDGEKELIWFLYCKATPIEETVQQSEANINYSTDSVVLTATEHTSLKRYYTFVDSEDENITEQMLEDFFTQVQTTDTIAAPTP
jgi:phi13 family phage major tail protein